MAGIFESGGSLSEPSNRPAIRTAIKHSLTTELQQKIAQSVVRTLFLRGGSPVRTGGAHSVDGLGDGDCVVQTGELLSGRCRGLAIGLVLAGKLLARTRQPLLD